MLSNVTWKEYLVAVIILLVLYYLFVGLKYYRAEIKALIGGKLPFKNKPGNKESQEHVSPDAIDSSSMDELEAVVHDLRYAILEKAGKQADKAELLKQFQQRLASYSGLRKPAYRVAINNFLIQHANEICGVVYSEGELNAAWDALPR